MTIPNLMTKIQKSQTETKLKRAFSVINQAYRLSYDENGDISGQEFLDSGMTSYEYFNKYWAPYIKQAHICKVYSDCGYKSSAPWSYINGSKVNISAVLATARTTFYTNDGILYVIFTSSRNSETGDAVGSSAMYIDINGGASPNVMGKDVFRLRRNVDGGSEIKFWGYNKSNEQVEESCKTYGDTCGEWIKRNGWKIPKDYPW